MVKRALEQGCIYTKDYSQNLGKVFEEVWQQLPLTPNNAFLVTVISKNKQEFLKFYPLTRFSRINLLNC